MNNPQEYFYILFNPEVQVMSGVYSSQPETAIHQIREKCFEHSLDSKMNTSQYKHIIEYGGVEHFYVVILSFKPNWCPWVGRWFFYDDNPEIIEWTQNHLDWHLTFFETDKNKHTKTSEWTPRPA